MKGSVLVKTSAVAGIFVLSVLAVIGVVAVWERVSNVDYTTGNCVRLQEGYTFTQPLVACDTINTVSTSDQRKLEAELEEIVTAAKDRGDVEVVSVFVRDLITRREVRLSPNEKFFPASLKKLPLMIALYRNAGQNFERLEQKILISDPTNYNADAAVPPEKFPEIGKEYTVAELIEYMIVYSDNISFQALLSYAGAEAFNAVYRDLRLDYADNLIAIDDYMTPYDYSLFFRALFNASYLGRAESEKALSVMSIADYDEGIVKGVPDDVRTAHKFGVGVVESAKNQQLGELHDCGIVYAKSPYFLCVMTKSKSENIRNVENVIAAVSEKVYARAKDGF